MLEEASARAATAIIAKMQPRQNWYQIGMREWFQNSISCAMVTTNEGGLLLSSGA
jgi:hypothetical protein